MSEVTTEDESDSCTDSITTSACRDCMTKYLIGMILQYLDASGFEQSYKTFWNECTLYGFPLPQSQGQSKGQGQEDDESPKKDLPTSSQLTFGPRDSNLLFKYFDYEEASLLLEQWQKFIDALDQSQQEDFKKITFFVRIFAAIIPFRKNESSDRKAEAMGELRDFFQKKSDEFSTDEKMLSLFALPFVAEPAGHPVFKDIFMDTWKCKLRIQLTLSIKRYSAFKNVPTPSSCDLVQMYMTSRDEEDEGSRGQDDRAVHLSDLKKAESTLLDVELRYHKLLKVTAEMVAALEAAVEGRDQDMSALRARVTTVFPELFSAFQQQLELEGQEGSAVATETLYSHPPEENSNGDQSEEYEEEEDSFSENYDTDSERGQVKNVQLQNDPIDQNQSDENYSNSNRESVSKSPKYSKNNEIYFEPTPRPRQSQMSPQNSGQGQSQRPNLKTLRRPKSKVNDKSLEDCDETPPSSTRRNSETRAIEKRPDQSQSRSKDREGQYHEDEYQNYVEEGHSPGKKKNHNKSLHRPPIPGTGQSGAGCNGENKGSGQLGSSGSSHRKRWVTSSNVEPTQDMPKPPRKPSKMSQSMVEIRDHDPN